MFPKISRAGVAKVTALALGIVLGSMLYALSDPNSVYKIDGRYLTFTQPRAMQALSGYQRLTDRPQVEQFVLFGGSGAYHAVNAEYVGEQLSQRLGRPVEVILVAFESQTLFDTLALIDALPESEGARRHVFFTWSFWRFYGPAEDVIQRYQAFNRHFFVNVDVERFITSDEFREALSPPEPYESWEDFVGEQSQPGRRSMFSTWTKYFILDKLQKWAAGRLEYLFKDPPAFQTADDISDGAVDHFLKAFARTEVQHSVDDNIRKLLVEVNDAADDQWRGERLAGLEALSTLVFQRVVRAADAATNDLTFLELPIAPEAERHSAIVELNSTIRSWIEQDVGADRMVGPKADDDLDRRESWWDLVHMTPFGARAYNEQLVDALAKVSGRE